MLNRSPYHHGWSLFVFCGLVLMATYLVACSTHEETNQLTTVNEVVGLEEAYVTHTVEYTASPTIMTTLVFSTPQPTTASLTVSRTAESPTVEPTETPVITDTVNFKLVYTRPQSDTLSQRSELLVYDTMSQMTKVIYTTEPGIIIGYTPMWHPVHNSQIFFLQIRLDNQTWSLWYYDLIQQQSYAVTSWFSNANPVISVDWSANGQWLRVYTLNTDPDMMDNEYILINTNDGAIVTLNLQNEHRGTWSPEQKDIFAYYNCTIDQEKVLINELPSLETIQSLSLGELLQENNCLSPIITWQPLAETLFILAKDPLSSKWVMYRSLPLNLDLEQQWDKLQELELPLPQYLLWSPSGEWLAYKANNKFIWVFHKDALTSPPKLVFSSSNTFYISWLTDPERLIVESQGKLWLVDPGKTYGQNALGILDLRLVDSFLLESGSSFDLREFEPID